MRESTEATEFTTSEGRPASWNTVIGRLFCGMRKIWLMIRSRLSSIVDFVNMNLKRGSWQRLSSRPLSILRSVRSWPGSSRPIVSSISFIRSDIR